MRGGGKIDIAGQKRKLQIVLGNDLTTKWCNGHGARLPLENFPDWQNNCFECIAERDKKYRERTSERHKTYCKEWYHKNKERLREKHSEYNKERYKNPKIRLMFELSRISNRIYQRGWKKLQKDEKAFIFERRLAQAKMARKINERDVLVWWHRFYNDYDETMLCLLEIKIKYNPLRVTN